jgi:N-acyl-D-amino-acid deacylase
MSFSRFAISATWLCLSAVCQQASTASSDADHYDLVLRAGRFLRGGADDGPVAGDLAIRAGRIAALGTFDVPPGTPVLPIDGLCIAPGGIDLHTHVDSEIARDPLGSNFLCMGVTTILTGNCGSSVSDLSSHLTRLEQGGIGLNYASLIGHGTVRRAVLGTEERDPSADELQRMQDLVAVGMRAGAFGLSTGLIYVPGIYAKTPELIALASVAGKAGGFYASHMRSENDDILTAIAEALRIGREAELPVQISHVKCTGKPNHGRAAEVLAALTRARAGGQRVGADQYAYDASSTGIDVLFPATELAIGRERFAAELAQPAFRARIHAALLQKMDQIGFGDFRHARIAAAKGNADLNGLLLPAAAERRLGRSDRDAQAELAIALFAAAAPERVSMIYHSMAEADVAHYLKQDWIAVASDAGLRFRGDQDKPHPRGAGNNPRVLGRYVREQGVLTLAQAIHKMTMVPARTLGLADRGELRVGARADLVVFDPDTIADRATWDEPLLPPVGIRAVFVNGQLAVDDGRTTGVRAGMVLRGPGTQR